MNDFECHLELYEIDPVRLATEAKVRYGTVYNAQKGNAITSENAQKIKAALERVTGVPYTGSFVLVDQENVQSPPVRITKTYPRRSP
jgi:hypothetical protein